MKTALKYVGAAVLIPVLSVAIYLGAVIQIYVLAFVIEGIGRIF